MKRTTVLAAACLLAASPASAASPQVEAAIASLAKLEANTDKMVIYCQIGKELDAAGEDPVKGEAADRKLEAFARSVSRDFIAALDLVEELDPESEDGKALNAAFDSLESKCPE